MYTTEVLGQGLQIEASRDMALIKISPTKLVELLMDVLSFLFNFSVTLFIEFLLIFIVQSRFKISHDGDDCR